MIRFHQNKTRHCISLISFHTRWTPTTAVAAKYKKTSPKVIKVTFHLIQRQKKGKTADTSKTRGQ